MVGECPMYSEACPVTSTLMQVELALEKNDLPKAKAEANKLSEQLERTMPDLARLAEKVSKSTTINQARTRLQELEKQMMSDVSATYQK
jgi:predicted nuclease with TOPRIM domain